jgi:hypothetical protein
MHESTEYVSIKQYIYLYNDCAPIYALREQGNLSDLVRTYYIRIYDQYNDTTISYIDRSDDQAVVGLAFGHDDRESVDEPMNI